MSNVRVQVPAFEEGWRVHHTARAITEQRVPPGFTVDVETWVTPSPSDLATCDTYQAAAAVPAATAHTAPRGKLSARNAAHQQAVQEGADVIVTWDADAPPLHDGVLGALLEPYDAPEVVATNGRPVARTAVGGVVNLAARLEDTVRPHLHGQLSSFTAAAWEQAGPFDTDVDETNIDEVRPEEEFSFYARLAEIGRVATAPAARVLNDTRRHGCTVDRAFGRFGTSMRPWCRRRGVDTFEQAENRESRR
jgi:hypothetical protein